MSIFTIIITACGSLERIEDNFYGFGQVIAAPFVSLHILGSAIGPTENLSEKEKEGAGLLAAIAFPFVCVAEVGWGVLQIGDLVLYGPTLYSWHKGHEPMNVGWNVAKTPGGIIGGIFAPVAIPLAFLIEDVQVTGPLSKSYRSPRWDQPSTPSPSPSSDDSSDEGGGGGGG